MQQPWKFDAQMPLQKSCSRCQRVAAQGGEFAPWPERDDIAPAGDPKVQDFFGEIAFKQP